MAFESVVRSLRKLVELHQQLINISEQKTDLIKEGKVEKLQEKVLQERKLVLQLEQYEKERQALVESWFISKDLTTEDMTISSILLNLDNEKQQNKLASVATELTEAITDLKRSEQLNRELLEQSMQFVQMSLHLLSPKIGRASCRERVEISEVAVRVERNKQKSDNRITQGCNKNRR